MGVLRREQLKRGQAWQRCWSNCRQRAEVFDTELAPGKKVWRNDTVSRGGSRIPESELCGQADARTSYQQLS
jgi:hypothetical protein